LGAYGDDQRFPWLKGVELLSQSNVIELTAPETKAKRIDIGTVGAFKVSAYLSKATWTDRLRFPKGGPFSSKELLKAGWYKTRGNISYLIEYKGLKFFFASSAGGRDFNDLREEVGRVDVLFQGIKGRDWSDKIASLMGALRPRYVVPTHYDNFLKDLESMTEFEYTARLASELIKYPEFLADFEPKYYYNARRKAWDWGYFYTECRLRLMKMFDYYSLEGLKKPAN
jgi:hypothetical protein